MKILQSEVKAAIKSNVVSMVSYLKFKIEKVIVESVAEDDGFLLLFLELDGEGISRLFDELAVPEAIAGAFNQEDIEQAHSELVEIGTIVKDTGLFKRLEMSKERLYRTAVRNAFDDFVCALQAEVKECVIDDEDHVRDGELPEEFDYTSVFNKVCEEYDVTNTACFNTED